MQQIMIQARAQTNAGKEFSNWCLSAFGPALLKDRSVNQLVVNVVSEVSPFLPYGRPEPLQGEEFDAILQVWVPDVQSFQKALAPMAAELDERTISTHIYSVTETEVINRFGSRQVGRTPGIKLIRGLFLHEDLPDAAAKRQWAHHSDLAVRVHVGLARYARHWVDAILTPGSPPIRGLSDLHFPDEKTMRERYFDSPRGMQEILHDTAHFIERGTQRFHGEEHILR